MKIILFVLSVLYINAAAFFIAQLPPVHTNVTLLLSTALVVAFPVVMVWKGQFTNYVQPQNQIRR